MSGLDIARLLLTRVVDQVRTSGPRPNTGFLASSLGVDILNEEGFVCVTPQLQVTNHPSVFAAGDVVEWEEQKQFGKTVGQAPVVAANIISFLADKPLKKKYTGSREIIALSNGKVWVLASLYMNVSDSSALRTPVVWRCLFAFPMGARFRSMVCQNGQVGNASAWIRAFQDGPVKIRIRGRFMLELRPGHAIYVNFPNAIV